MVDCRGGIGFVVYVVGLEMSDDEAVLRILNAIKLIRENTTTGWGQITVQLSGSEIKFVNVVLPMELDGTAEKS